MDRRSVPPPPCASTETNRKRKCTLPTQALSCSGSKGLSQPDLPTSQPNYYLELKQIQATLVHLLCQFSSKTKKSSPKLKHEK
jgi:hypothetical protein